MDLRDVVITTNRLKIVPTHEKYVDSIFQELTPEVATYLSFDPTGKREDTIGYIRSSREKMQKDEDFAVVLLDKISEEFIGGAGIHTFSTPHPELGIWIKKSAQGKGYGKEIIGGLIEWAKENLNYEYLVYPVAKDNIRSRKLIESLGGVLSGEKIYTSPAGKVLDEVEYRLYR